MAEKQLSLQVSSAPWWNIPCVEPHQQVLHVDIVKSENKCPLLGTQPPYPPLSGGKKRALVSIRCVSIIMGFTINICGAPDILEGGCPEYGNTKA